MPRAKGQGKFSIFLGSHQRMGFLQDRGNENGQKSLERFATEVARVSKTTKNK
jgi:hypothetical protein